MILISTSVNIDWGKFDIDQHRHEHCSKNETVYNTRMQPKFKSKKQIHANILEHKAKKCLESYQQVGDWHLIEKDAWYHDSVIVAVHSSETEVSDTESEKGRAFMARLHQKYKARSSTKTGRRSKRK